MTRKTIWIFSLVTSLSLLVYRAEAQKYSPETTLRAYYAAINAGDLKIAYAMRSKAQQQQTSFAEFNQIWSNNKRVAADEIKVVARKPNRVQVHLMLYSEDVDRQTGATYIRKYEGKVKMVLEGGLWRYDDGSFIPISPKLSSSSRTNSYEQGGSAVYSDSGGFESQIEDEFEGWEGETVVKLTNGQIWVQTEYHYEYHYAYRPNVILYRTGGGWKMKVDGVSKAVGVERIR